jgi:hypothetical protein
MDGCNFYFLWAIISYIGLSDSDSEVMMMLVSGGDGCCLVVQSTPYDS